jgi:cysteine desulfurase
MTINAGKIYGPKQTGALFIKSGTLLQPMIYGGGQERNLRSGTENVANCIGFAEAMRTVRATQAQEVERLTDLQHKIIDKLVDNDRITLNGAQGRRRLVNNIHLTIEGTDNERLLMELDERGIQIATGSACSASSDQPSHVLAAIGLPDRQSRSSIRITLGRQTTQQQCEYLIKSIKELVAKP